jgi:enoyl-[acyl-carrier protein] reductase I
MQASTGLFAGKKGVIMGVANEHSLAAGVAEFLSQQGAELAFSHLPDKDGRDRMEKRVRRVTDNLNTKLLAPCDVSSNEDITAFFAKVGENLGSIDFFVHSIAFAPLEDIRCPTVAASRLGFLNAMDISVYSFIATAKAASELMTGGGSMVTMTYFGAEKVLAGYNLMGVCKAALEASVRYLANDLGPKNIRVNGLSAGPVKTLAASAVGDFSSMLKMNAAIAPLGRNVTNEDVGRGTAMLLSDLASSVTGEILHVDSGYNIMGSPGHALERLGLKD